MMKVGKFVREVFRLAATRKVLKNTKLHIVLFALCGVFAIAWVTLFLVQWNEGETAAQNSELLLEAAGIKPPAATAKADAQTNTRPANEAVPDLPVELKGYSVIARLDIDILDLHLPILSEPTKEALKASVCYYTGPDPGGEGNLVITGHNYRNGAHFGRLDKLTVGDMVSITGREGNTYSYAVYKLEHIKPDDTGILDDTQYSRELSLLTCEASGNGRLLVRCRQTG